MSLFKIVGVYRGIREVIDETDNKDDAEYLRREYALAFGKDWSVWVEDAR